MRVTFFSPSAGLMAASTGSLRVCVLLCEMHPSSPKEGPQHLSTPPQRLFKILNLECLKAFSNSCPSNRISRNSSPQNVKAFSRCREWEGRRGCGGGGQFVVKLPVNAAVRKQSQYPGERHYSRLVWNESQCTGDTWSWAPGALPAGPRKLMTWAICRNSSHQTTAKCC